MFLSFGGLRLQLAQNKQKKRKYGDKQNKVIDNLKWKARVVKKEHTPQCSLMLASNQGFSDKEVLDQFECNCGGHSEEFENLVVNTGLYSIVDRLIDVNNENTDVGFVKYLEVGMNNTAVNAGQTALVRPKARKQITQAYRDTTNAVFKTFFNGTQANSATSQVAIGTSTTQFTVLSGQGSLFAAGQLIEVGLGSPQIREILTVVSDTITLTSALGSIPSGGEDVKQAYGELGLFGNATASETIGSGSMYARTVSFIQRTKDSGFGMTIEWHITLT